MDTEIKEYIDTTLSDWLYQPHILEMIEHKTFLENGPIVLNRIDNEDYMQIPLFRQVAYLCETVRAAEKLKLTTAEILPRALLHGIYRFVIPVHYFEENIARLRMENGWYTVSLTRLLAEIGGPIKKRSNALTQQRMFCQHQMHRLTAHVVRGDKAPLRGLFLPHHGDYGRIR